MRVPRSSLAAVLAAAGLLLAAGCTTAGQTHGPSAAAPAAAPVPPVGSPAPSAPIPSAPAAVSATGEVPPGEAAVGTLDLLVESTPPGAIIVLDGVPVGRAPLHLQIAATPLGFFREYREIRARFLATDEEQVTRSAVVEFTPREKVPAVVRFTPDGAQRTMR